MKDLAEKKRATVRAGPLVNISRVLLSLGCEPTEVFEAAMFPPEDLADPDHRIDYRAAATLLAHCTRHSACDHFGLLVAQWFLPAHLGLTGKLIESAPDVGAALEELVEYLDLHDDGGVATLRTSGDKAYLGYAIHLQNLDGIETIYDLSATNICGIMRGLCGLRWRPSKVILSRTRPVNIRPYRDCFACPVAFDATDTEIEFPSRWLRRKPQLSDRGLHDQLFTTVRQRHREDPAGLAVRVRDLLRRELVATECNVESVAGFLKLHPRTLHRRLRDEDTSFREILDGVRRAVAQHYLAGTGLSVGDIAAALGYSSTDAFDHAFRRWFGTSPRAWRKANTPPAHE